MGISFRSGGDSNFDIRKWKGIINNKFREYMAWKSEKRGWVGRLL